MDEPDQEAIEKGEAPRWQLWAMLMVLLGCVATVASTFYDIA